MSASLVIHLQKGWTFTHRLDPDKPTSIGRADQNDVKIPESEVSSRHAVILRKGDDWILRDLKSTNGTFVKGQRVGEFLLGKEEVITIGHTEMIFRNSGATVATSSMAGPSVYRRLRDRTDELRKSAEEPSVINLPDVMAYDPEKDAERARAAGSKPAETQTSGSPVQKVGLGTPLPLQQVKADVAWIADELTAMVSLLERNEHQPKDSLYQIIVTRLHSALGAENSFLMLANSKTHAWEIRAWAGGVQEWSAYEHQRPVPLAVANKAFIHQKILCNSLEGMQAADPSQSLMNLNVLSYLAVPLMHQQGSIGVLYFDHRRGYSRFLQRHLHLAQRAGEYVVDISLSRSAGLHA